MKLLQKRYLELLRAISIGILNDVKRKNQYIHLGDLKGYSVVESLGYLVSVSEKMGSVYEILFFHKNLGIYDLSVIISEDGLYFKTLKLLSFSFKKEKLPALKILKELFENQ